MSTMATGVRPESAADTGGVSSELQRTLYELIALSLIAKQAHWNVRGQLFRPLHEHFDEIAASMRDWADAVAERLEAIDSSADGRAPAVAAGAGLQPMPEGKLDGPDAVRLVAERVGEVASRVRQRVQTVGDADQLSQDVLIEVGRGLDKQLWMLREQTV